MKTCKDCLHNEACESMLKALGYTVDGDGISADKRCNEFKDKNRYAEVVRRKERRIIMKIMLDEGAKMPTRAHPWDAGLDLYTPRDVYVSESRGHGTDYCSSVSVRNYAGSAVIDTGVHVEIPEGYVGLIKSKSGLNVKQGLTAEGVIDAHYTGSIRVKIYNHKATPYQFKAGDKIAQLVILPCLLPELELVDSLEETDRGDGGFGSTGR